MKRLLNHSEWDEHAVRDDVRDFVVETIGSKDGVLIGDDTGFLKKGVKSAGVQRQYSGTAGRTENCQIGTFLAYASAKGRALIDRELYVPTSWTDDRDRCRAAGIDDTVPFATRSSTSNGCCNGPSTQRYRSPGSPRTRHTGRSSAFARGWKNARWRTCWPPRSTTPSPPPTAATARVDELIAALPKQAWKRISAGAGAHGQRIYHWARVAIRPVWEGGYGHWVLARRSLADPTEIAYYICYGPAASRLTDQVTTAGARWQVEECFQTAKGECGLDHYQVRLYRAWYRHITLAMAVLAYLTAIRAQEAAKGAAEMTSTTSYPSASRRSGLAP
ncbi:IS701 family transposase [Streptomyces sp. NPDC058423]|uniref:IS701 family transposase n=1 Tax=unclassified Streptomyces TaxID=2593676 RepID=UPI00364BBB21